MRVTMIVGVAAGVTLGSALVRAQPGADAPVDGGAALQTDAAADATSAPADAPRPRTIDLSAFVGLNAFSDDIELGNAWAAEQVPGTALMIGGRAGITLLPDLAPGSALDPQLGVEGELKLALASTGESMDGGRDAYFAPVFGWRAHAILRLRTAGAWHPHVVVGGGGETVVSSSPFIGNETDAAFHWGPGVAWRASDRLIARADLRHGVTAGRAADRVSTLELQVGLETSFDLGGGRVEPLPPLPPDTDGDGLADPDDACPTEAETVNGFQDDDGCPDAVDTDGDGIKDPDDACPAEPEDVDGFQDDDGCPEADNDGDGIADGADVCPLEAEDLDQFQDEDGCPDLDNDGDGIEDRVDACPLEAETINGFEDGDGCADELPKVVKEFTGVIAGITFEYSRARIQKKSHAVLKKAAQVLLEYPDLRVRIEGHTDDRGIYEKNLSLSQRRAEAVKWFLVDRGIAADRIETVGLGPDQPRASNKKASGRAQNRRIEFHLITGGGGAATQPSAPATQPTAPSAPATQPSAPATQPTAKPATP